PLLCFSALAAEVFLGGGDPLVATLLLLLLPTLVPSVLLLGVQATLLLHIALWQVLLRPLYSIQRHNLLFTQRKASAAVGAYLVTAAVLPEFLGPSVLWRVLLKQFGVDFHP